MLPQHVAICVHKIPGRVRFARVLLDEIGIRAVLHKADVLTVVLSRIDEIVRLRKRAHFTLLHAAERELHVL